MSIQNIPNDYTKPLPNYLVQRYKGWKATTFSDNESWYAHLAEHGQNPRVMTISCCDSRLHLTTIFGTDAGEVFIHRNIANLVPPYTVDDSLHGTSAAIEYAVSALKVANLIVIGHSKCGGVEGAYQMFHENKKSETQFLGPWLELLRPGYDQINGQFEGRAESLMALEKQSVVISLQNLMSFPFVREAVEDRRLALHGLWHDIGKGEMSQYISQNNQFEPL